MPNAIQAVNGIMNNVVDAMRKPNLMKYEVSAVFFVCAEIPGRL